MDYFSILNLDKEPFSNSPDPEFFFQSRQHLDCLQKLELSLRLKRGLNVVIGDVGTGKTTLCRQLIRKFATDEEMETHLILDPYFNTSSEFLATVAEMLEGKKISADTDEWQIKEIIKQHIFRKGVEEKKTVILIIDEGQKIPVFCLEILREFLNYETNEFKLLQIVIFAQKEFETRLTEYSNFADRINLYHVLESLDFKDTRLMIQYRLKQASSGTKAPSLFSYPALWGIYHATGGYPRKIINLCHRSILTMIIQNRTRGGWLLVRSCARRNGDSAKLWIKIATAVCILLVVGTLMAGVPERFRMPAVLKTEKPGTTNNHDQPGQVVCQKIQKEADPQQVREAALQPDRMSPNLLCPESEVDRSADGKSITAIEVLPESPLQISDDENGLPLLLGKVALKRKETLWRLIEKIYGVFDRRYQKTIARENSFIEDPDHIEAGRLIAIPAIPMSVEPLPTPLWWVSMGEKHELGEAIQALRSYPDTAPSIRLIPHWNPRKGLKFTLLLREYFYDETSALKQMERLPPWVAPEGKILSSWDEDTVFFSDPFLGP